MNRSPATTTSTPAASSAVRKLNFGIYLLLAVFVICSLLSWARVAAHESLWMDEILAVWTARLPTFHDVFLAPFQGSDFSPLTYHFLLHSVMILTGGSHLALRFPSLLAVLVSALCVFHLLKRHAGISSAAFGTVLCLLGLLSSYALEARPYSLVVACFALTLLLWDGLDRGPAFILRVCGITLLLALSISLHFYAVLLIPCLALMEVAWLIVHSRLRMAVWLGMTVAGASSFLFLPLIRAISKFNTGDTASISYYAKPAIARLVEAYNDFFLYGRRPLDVLLALLCLAALAYALDHTPLRVKMPRLEESFRHVSGSANLYIIVLGTLVFPALVFVFARLVTRTFNPRYCLVACLGMAILTAYVIGKLPRFNLIVTPLLLFCCLVALIPATTVPATVGVRLYSAAMLSELPGPYPIVIAEGLQYLQFVEAAPEPLKRRLVYVTDPGGVVSPDPTNNNQVKRWRPLRPELRIIDPPAFFAQNQRFYLLVTPTSTNVLTDWLRKKNALGKPVLHEGDVWVFDAEAPR